MFLVTKLYLALYLWQALCAGGFLGGASGKESTWQCRRQERRIRSLGREDPLEQEVAPHSSILAWKIPWTEETAGLQSMGLQRVGHD